MSQLVKTKRQAIFKDFKWFGGAFKGLFEQKNVVFNSFVCKLGFFWHSGAFLASVRQFKTLVPIYTQTRQINYYFDEYINFSKIKLLIFLKLKKM
jgi:hypothetical protein